MEQTQNEIKLAKAIEEGQADEYKLFKIPAWLAAKKSDKSKRHFQERFPKGVPIAANIEEETEDAFKVSSVATVKIEKKNWKTQEMIDEVIEETKDGEFHAFSYTDFPSRTWMPKSEIEVIE